MAPQNHTLTRLVARIQRGLDVLLYAISTYMLPLVIALVSLLALGTWKSQYPVVEPRALNMQVLQTDDPISRPGDVLERLDARPATQIHETRLAETPVWIAFSVPSDLGSVPLVIEFPSRHASDISCWDARSLHMLGSASRASTSGAMTAIKAGFALSIEENSGLQGQRLLCRSSASGPGRLSAVAWRATDLQISVDEFHRKSGLLDGGVLILALFVLVTALVNRNALYVLFAAWLVVNLRLAALSAGWDMQWLGAAIPQEWLLRFRSLTLSFYFVLAVTLFKVLFADDLKHIGAGLPMKLAQWACVPVLLVSTVLSYQDYLPILWTSTGLIICVLAYYLIRILRKTRSPVAMWYGASVGITIIASSFEVISAALGVKGLSGAINSVTAALSSSLLAALAIAEQMRQEHVQRLDAQAELAHTFEALPIGLFTLDMQGRFLSANPALLAMLNTEALREGSDDWQQHFVDGAWTQLHQTVHAQQHVEMEILGKKHSRSSAEKRFLVKATLARDKIEGSLQDVTDKSRATDDLQFLANHDSLTKVLNRHGIERALSAAIAEAGENQALALAYLDLDRFKLINDLYGHGAGDDVLCQVCERTAEMLSRDLQFGRVGGDEFVIIFPQTHIALATLTCKSVVDRIGTKPYRVGEKAFYVRGSIGLVEVSSGMQFNDAMSSADRACRQAKSNNGSSLVVYEKDALAFQQHEAELKLIALLATSAANDGLFVEMQPIMSLTAPRGSLNFEVLLRMRGTDGSLVPTDRLIAAGEASGRMGMIDRWVLSTTLDWLHHNHKYLRNTQFVCMNLSGASINDEKFLQNVYALLEKNLHIAGLLCLEITESVALQDLGNTRRFVDKVRGYGAKVALDDFGAGYTSFSYLKEFRADLLKIDGGFIVNMNKHPTNVAIVEAIVNLAKNLGMKVVAEWAEDNATVQTLTEIGVDYVQGFAIARAQHPDQMLANESSASFIQDDELAQYASLIGKADTLVTQVDLFADVSSINVH